jgi:endonuclease/exonuclease/phosphatase (EEP) superfamily protein YafD
VPSGLEATLLLLAAAYIIVLLVWVVFHPAFERVQAGFFLNSLAHLLFLPAPAVLILGLVLGQPGLLAAGAAPALGFSYFWLLPHFRFRFRRGPDSNGPKLRVATFNLLWLNDDLDALVVAIRALDADVVALQEVTPASAAAIETALDSAYPHRLLFSRPKAAGMGLISRIPLTASPDTIPDRDWIGDPVIATLSFAGRDVSILSCHAARVVAPARARERQARALVEYARNLNTPCIVMGDFNSTPLNGAYRILARGLIDAWHAAGRGLGHTFPGPAWNTASGDGLPKSLRRIVPRWLIRIDYIFVSRHWRPICARIGPLDGSSDHRPLEADLRLQD